MVWFIEMNAIGTRNVAYVKIRLSPSRNQRLPYYYTVLLVAVLSIFVVLTTTYFIMRKTLVQRMIDSSAKNLLSVMEIQDTILNQAGRTANTIAADPDILNLTRLQSEKESLRFYRAYQSLVRIGTENDFFKTISVYYLNEERIVATGWGLSSMMDYQRHSGKSYADIPVFRGLFVRTSTPKDANSTGSIEMLLYLPVNYWDAPKALLSLSISSDYFKALHTTMNSLGGDFYLTNDSYEVIYGSTAAMPQGVLPALHKNAEEPTEDSVSNFSYIVQSINGEEMLISQAVSPLYGLTYIHTIPVSAITADVNFLVYSIMLVAALMILLSAFGAFFTIRQIFKPFDSLSTLFAATPDAKIASTHLAPKEIARNMSHLFNQNKSLLKKNQHMEEMLEKNKARQKNVFLWELLDDAYIPADLYENLSYYQIDFRPEMYYCLMLLCIDDYEAYQSGLSAQDRNLFSLYLNDLLATELDAAHSFIPVETGGRELCLIFYREEGDIDLPGALFKTGNALLHKIREESGVSVTIGISQEAKGLEVLPVCYRQARTARDCRWVYGANQVYAYDSGQQPSPYPHEIEKRLIAALKAKEDDALLDQLRQFHLYIIRAPGTSIYMAQHCFLQLLSAVYRCIYECFGTFMQALPSESEMYAKLLDLQDTDGFYTELQGFLSKLLMEFNHSYTQRHLALIRQIQQYIEKNYVQDISLDSISRDFQISPSHLRRIFKENTGISLKVYIDAVRMDNAKRLLLCSDKPIADIAQMVGYVSQQTFIRVFKKEFAATPGEYRREHINPCAE